MLRGERIVLRLVREQDLAALHSFETDLDTRGSYYPLGVRSESALRAEFDRNGLWNKDEGTLLMPTGDEEIVGACLLPAPLDRPSLAEVRAELVPLAPGAADRIP